LILFSSHQKVYLGERKIARLLYPRRKDHFGIVIKQAKDAKCAHHEEPSKTHWCVLDLITSTIAYAIPQSGSDPTDALLAQLKNSELTRESQRCANSKHPSIREFLIDALASLG